MPGRKVHSQAAASKTPNANGKRAAKTPINFGGAGGGAEEERKKRYISPDRKRDDRPNR